MELTPPEMYRRLRPIAAALAITPADFDDLIQEAALALWIDGRDVWNDLTYTVAKRRMIDFNRTRYGRFGSYKRTAVYTVPLQPTLDGHPDPELQAVEDRVDAARIPWHRLTVKQRVAVELRATGMTLAEVGRRLGITESAVCLTMKRAARRLRLQEDPDESVHEQADRCDVADRVPGVGPDRRTDVHPAVGAP